jgi:hypothetical protein
MIIRETNDTRRTMMRRGIAVSLLWLAGVLVASAQTTGTLNGRVVDGGGKPTPGATVRVDGTMPTRGAVVRNDGSFMVAGIRAGEYDVKVTAPGFLPVTRRVRISVDQTTTMNLTLAAAPADSKPPIVVPDRPLSGSRTIVVSPYLTREVSRGFTIRGGRPGGSIPVRNIQVLEPVELSPATGEISMMQIHAAGMPDVVTAAPSRFYRPAVAASRRFLLNDDYPFPYGRRMFDFGDDFAGSFGGGFYPILVLETPVDQHATGSDRYGIARRDVVEPSMEKRAEWIRRYEERRDMMSENERELASWARPR